MKGLVKDFEKKNKAGGRPVFMKSLDFYLDGLKKYEYKKVLVALEEEIQALKRELEEMLKIKVDRIKIL